jgi:hypothetical protein
MLVLMKQEATPAEIANVKQKVAALDRTVAGEEAA